MSTGTVSGVGLRCLGPVLKKWTALNHELGKSWGEYGDTPWWYSERAFISVFAGAVWRSGGHVFEEYSEVKRRKKKPFSGRVDLWFAYGRYEFLAEVKHCWLAATSRRDRTEQVRECMDDAKADVRRCHPYGMRRLAVVFGSPYVARHLRQAIGTRIDWLTEQASDIRSEIGADAVAWTFPPLRRYPIGNGFIFPGAIMWIKEVRR